MCGPPARPLALGRLAGPRSSPRGTVPRRTVPASGGGPFTAEIAHVRHVARRRPGAVHRPPVGRRGRRPVRLPPSPPAGPRGGAGRGPRRRLERLGRVAPQG